ncbi:hypothetical protein BT96DRAFT_303686 [Gymnopus androsaceus JB14]|uniref:Uncharacterized protein n=1 Tax=Gymnopus androsaceus JB14 TaxID=1447944 RepID=A0A6A4H2J4_9AGAR|nr:hypothetical protein BT96DRAFT_303686 [Gymnopus androsaceus JB14]
MLYPDSPLNHDISQISSAVAGLNLTQEAQTTIHQLPSELLSLIFELACTENLLQEYPWESEYNEAPTELSSPVISYLPALAISAVCLQWRSLALNLPSLWSRLKLEILENSTAPDAFMDTLRLYLERSAQTPLFLDIFIGLFHVSNPPALDLLLQHTRQWKTVRCITDRYLSNTPLSLPVLEDLTIGLVRGWVDDDIFHCFRAAPKLHALTIYRGSDSLKEGLLSKLPPDQLTFLSTVLLYSEMDTLRELRNLTILELHVSGYKTDKPPIVLAGLKSFTLTVAHPFGIRADRYLYIFHMFTFPSLTELVVRRDKDYRSDGKLVWSANAFNDFLSRSCCILTTFSMSSISISDLDFIAVLRRLPFLVTLGFDNLLVPDKQSPITTLFISSLTLRGSDSESEPDSMLVPNLCSVCINLVKGTLFDDHAFANMILSRRLPHPSVVGVVPLRSVVLRFHAQDVGGENALGSGSE